MKISKSMAGMLPDAASERAVSRLGVVPWV